MKIFAIDPGPEHTGYCQLHDGAIGEHGWIPNRELLQWLHLASCLLDYTTVIESPQPQDNPLGPALRNTILWAGRYIEALESRGATYQEVDERDIRAWITGSRTGDNAALKQELKNIFGDKRQELCATCEANGQIQGKRGLRFCPTCKGKKYTMKPGPLVGFGEHEISALAVAWVIQKQADIEQQRAALRA